jgi:hypothetical protein
MQNPQLYKLLFGLTDLGGVHKLSADAATPWDLAEGVDALSVLLSAVERVIEAGRIRPQEPTPAATQILSATHGFVLLAMSGFIDPPRTARRDGPHGDQLDSGSRRHAPARQTLPGRRDQSARDSGTKRITPRDRVTRVDAALPGGRWRSSSRWRISKRLAQCQFRIT